MSTVPTQPDASMRRLLFRYRTARAAATPPDPVVRNGSLLERYRSATKTAAPTPPAAPKAPRETAPPLIGRAGRTAVAQGMQAPSAATPPQTAFAPSSGYIEDIGRGLSRGIPAISRQVGGAVEAFTPFKEAGRSVREEAQAAMNEMPPPGTFVGQVAESVPSFAAAIGAGAAGAAAAPLVGAGAMAAGAAGLATGAGTAGVQAGGGYYADAVQRLGDDPEAQSKARAGAVPVAIVSAITNTIPLAGYLGRFAPNLLNSAISRIAGNAVGRAAIQSAAEGSQEAIEEISQMLAQRVAEDDPDAFNDFAARVGMSAAGGAVLGGAADIGLGAFARAAQSVPTAGVAENAPNPKPVAEQVGRVNPVPVRPGPVSAGGDPVVNLVRLAIERGIDPAQPARDLRRQLASIGVASPSEDVGQQAQADPGNQQAENDVLDVVGVQDAPRSGENEEAAQDRAVDAGPQSANRDRLGVSDVAEENNLPVAGESLAPNDIGTQDEVLREEFESRSQAHAARSKEIDALVSDRTLSAPGADVIREVFKDTEPAFLERFSLSSGDVRDGSGTKRLASAAGLPSVAKIKSTPAWQAQIKLLRGLSASGAAANEADAEPVLLVMHETAHVGYRGLLSGSDRKAVEEVFASKDQQYWSRWFARGMQAKGKPSDYAASNVEEFFAHAFADWVLTERVPDSRLQRLFQRMKNVLRNAVMRASRRGNVKALQPYFEAVLSGKRGAIPQYGKPPKVRTISRKSIEDALLSQSRAMGIGTLEEMSGGAPGEQSNLGEDFEGAFVFYKRLPTEVLEFIEGRPQFRTLFRVTNNRRLARGHDHMHEMGERYWEFAERLVGGVKREVRDAVSMFDGEGVPPELRMMSKALQAAKGVRGGRLVMADAADLPDGTSFTLGLEKFTLATEPDGTRVIVDGERIPISFGGDASSVMMDQGSLKVPKNQASGNKLAREALNALKERTENPSADISGLPGVVAAGDDIPFARSLDTPGQIGIFSGERTDRSTGRQAALFGAPTDRGTASPSLAADDPRREGESEEDYRIRRKFREAEKNTGALFARKANTDQTETPEFKRWFRDSKVVNDDGTPKVVYHGTARGFNEFFIEENDGAWFASDPQTANYHALMRSPDAKQRGARGLPVYLSIKNPLVVDEYGSNSFPDHRKLREARRDGHDGVVFVNRTDGIAWGKGDLWVAFSPTQIKSATGNAGTFDPENPDIRFSRALDITHDDPAFPGLAVQRTFDTPAPASVVAAAAAIRQHDQAFGLNRILNRIERVPLPRLLDPRRADAQIKLIARSIEERAGRLANTPAILRERADSIDADAARVQEADAAEAARLVLAAKQLRHDADVEEKIGDRRNLTRAADEVRDFAAKLTHFARLAQKHANRDIEKAHAALDGLSRKERANVAMIGLGMLDPAKATKAESDAARALLEVMDGGDSGMNRAAALGMQRRGRGGKWRPLTGGGKWMPMHLSATGKKVLRDLGKYGEKAPSFMAMVDEMQAARPEATRSQIIEELSEFLSSITRGTNPYFESVRTVLPAKYIDLDPLRVLPRQIARNARTVAAGEVYGGYDKARQLPGVQKLLSTLDAYAEPEEAQAIRKYVTAEFGAPLSASEQRTRAWTRRIIATQNIIKLSGLWTPLQDMVQPWISTADYGLVPRLRVYFQEFPPIIGGLVNRRAAALAERAGATQRGSGVLDIPDAIPTAGEALDRIQDATLILKRMSEHGSQVRTYLIAQHAAEKALSDLAALEGKSGPLKRLFVRSVNGFGTENARAAIERRLQRLGLTRERMSQIVAGGRRLTDEELEIAGWLMVHDTQFLMTTASKPVFYVTHPWVRIFAQYKTFPLRQAGLMATRMFNEARVGNVAPLAAFGLAALLGRELLQILRDYAFGEDRSIASHLANAGKDGASAQTVAGRAMNHLIKGGLLGPLADLDFGLGAWVLGPTVGTAADAYEAVENFAINPSAQQATLAAKDFLSGQIPAMNQYARAFRAAGANPEFTEFRRARSLAYSWRDRNSGTAGDAAIKIARRSIFGPEEHPPTERSMTYEYAAAAIDSGSQSKAVQYIAALLEGTTAAERAGILRGLKQSADRRSPLGPLSKVQRIAYLNTLESEDRRKVESLDFKWRQNYAKAVHEALSRVTSTR